MKPIIIIGNGVIAQVLYHLIQRDSQYKIEGFAVDKKYLKKTTFLGLPNNEINKLKNLYDKSKVKILLAMGYNNLNKDREIMYQRISEIGFNIETYIHPQANVYSNDIGDGCIIFPGVVVDPYCKIGKNCILWSNSTCAHHSKVHDNVWIASGSLVSGNAEVLSNTFLGIGSTIVNEIKIGKSNIIGAGALITKNTSDNEVYLQKSAQKIPFNSIDYAKFNGY